MLFGDSMKLFLEVCLLLYILVVFFPSSCFPRKTGVLFIFIYLFLNGWETSPKITGYFKLKLCVFLICMFFLMIKICMTTLVIDFCRCLCGCMRLVAYSVRHRFPYRNSLNSLHFLLIALLFSWQIYLRF